MVPRSVSRIAIFALAAGATVLVSAKNYPYSTVAKGDLLSETTPCAAASGCAAKPARYATGLLTSEAGVTLAVRVQM